MTETTTQTMCIYTVTLLTTPQRVELESGFERNVFRAQQLLVKCGSSGTNHIISMNMNMCF